MNSRPKMSAAEATSFATFSRTSFLQLNSALKSRRQDDPAFHQCDCEPYQDTFTFNRWKAQGFFVMPGQHCLRFSTYAPWTKTSTDDEGNQVTEDTGLHPITAKVFCRCQVARKS